MLWRAMTVIDAEEFKSKALLAIWPKIKDRDRSRILSKIDRGAKKAQGLDIGQRLSNEELIKELSKG